MGKLVTILKINEFIEVMPYGATCPIKLEANDGKIYVLKTFYNSVSVDGNGLFRELYSYLFLQNIGYNCLPKIGLVNTREEDIEKFNININPSSYREKEALCNLKKSVGLNLIIEWIPNSEFPIYDDLIKDKFFIDKTIYADGYLLNTDRSMDNPNILYDGEKYYLIDFSESFLSGFALDDLAKYCEKFIFDDNYLLLEQIKKIDNMLHNNVTECRLGLDIDKWNTGYDVNEINKCINNRISNKEIFNAENI